jgi:uncharacterized protein
MKLHTSTTLHYQTVTAYDDSSVEINAHKFDYSLIVLPEVAPMAWPVTAFEQLEASHFEQIAQLNPDVVIFGSGRRQRFVHPALLQSLSVRQIGVECMDSKAACRTYNILMGEGRKVLLALLLEQTDTGAA